MTMKLQEAGIRVPCVLPKPCPLAGKCGYYHSPKEIKKWEQKGLHGKSEKDEINDVIASAKLRHKKQDNTKAWKEHLPVIIGSHSVHCDKNMFIMHLEKDTNFHWNFELHAQNNLPLQLRKVVLLDDDLPEFYIKSIKNNKICHHLPVGCQILHNTYEDLHNSTSCQVTIEFFSRHYGNFDQRIAFDFGDGRRVFRTIGVQVSCEVELLRALQYQPPLTNEDELTWLKLYRLIPFNKEDKIDLSSLPYPLPPNIDNLVSYGAFDYLNSNIEQSNYRDRQHVLLYLEEHKRRQELQKISFMVDDLREFVKEPISGVSANDVLVVPLDGYFIQKLSRILGKSGRALAKISHGESFVVYEIRFISYSGEQVLFELNTELNKFLVNHEEPVRASICFRFVDVFQYMHAAVDKISLDVIFPVEDETIPSAWRAELQPELSKEQSNALYHITDSLQRPPVLILGPFGSGKTRTLAESIEKLLDTIAEELCCTGNSEKRILLCTHSNSAADHYINDYIHNYLSRKGGEEAEALKPLRINWEYRYTSAMSDIVLSYSLVDQSSGNFLLPTLEELNKHRLIICTLVTANILWNLELQPGYFSHIIIDEAAQAMEVETIIPLTFAAEETRIVLAGDHLQLSPPVFSSHAKELGLGKSLLERLYEEYPAESPCKLKFLENFRSWKDIVDIASTIFYSGSLLCNSTRPSRIPYPVCFHGIRGKEELSTLSPSYLNSAEASEVLSIVIEVKASWDKAALGPFRQHEICVMASYTAQVQEIRKILRRSGFSGVRVDTIQNVQGLEFTVVIISCVRTYCDQTIEDEKNGEDLGYLSDAKMLNTAITRAKRRCCFVGDPVALCKLGSCRPCWKMILGKCDEQKTFYYRLGFNKVMEMLNKEADLRQKGVTDQPLSPLTHHRNLDDQGSGVPAQKGHLRTGVERQEPYPLKDTPFTTGGISKRIASDQHSMDTVCQVLEKSVCITKSEKSCMFKSALTSPVAGEKKSISGNITGTMDTNIKGVQLSALSTTATAVREPILPHTTFSDRYKVWPHTMKTLSAAPAVPNQSVSPLSQRKFPMDSGQICVVPASHTSRNMNDNKDTNYQFPRHAQNVISSKETFLQEYVEFICKTLSVEAKLSGGNGTLTDSSVLTEISSIHSHFGAILSEIERRILLNELNIVPLAINTLVLINRISKRLLAIVNTEGLIRNTQQIANSMSMDVNTDTFRIYLLSQLELLLCRSECCRWLLEPTLEMISGRDPQQGKVRCAFFRFQFTEAQSEKIEIEWENIKALLHERCRTSTPKPSGITPEILFHQRLLPSEPQCIQPKTYSHVHPLPVINRYPINNSVLLYPSGPTPRATPYMPNVRFISRNYGLVPRPPAIATVPLFRGPFPLVCSQSVAHRMPHVVVPMVGTPGDSSRYPGSLYPGHFVPMPRQGTEGVPGDKGYNHVEQYSIRMEAFNKEEHFREHDNLEEHLKDDEEVQEWLSKREDDPFAQEYNLLQERATAARLPSPNAIEYGESSTYHSLAG